MESSSRRLLVASRRIDRLRIICVSRLVLTREERDRERRSRALVVGAESLHFARRILRYDLRRVRVAANLSRRHTRLVERRERERERRKKKKKKREKRDRDSQVCPPTKTTRESERARERASERVTCCLAVQH